MNLKKLEVQGKEISLVLHLGEDYISLTDMVRDINGVVLIEKWLRNKYAGLRRVCQRGGPAECGFIRKNCCTMARIKSGIEG